MLVTRDDRIATAFSRRLENSVVRRIGDHVIDGFSGSTILASRMSCSISATAYRLTEGRAP